MKELIAMIGKTGYIMSNGWIVEGRIIDVKRVYGTDKLYFEQNGHCALAAWINADTFKGHGI